MARKLIFDIIDILKDTDEVNKCTRRDMECKLRAMGIEGIDRHTIRNCMEFLNDVGFNIIIENGRENKYYLGERLFEEWEVKLICDLMYQCDFLDEKDIFAIINKLKNFIGKSSRKLLEDTYSYKRRSDHDNVGVKYTIDKIIRAIASNKKIAFRYCEYNDKLIKVPKNKDYIVSPYKLLLKQGHYYLMLNKEGYTDVAFYRIDRISNVEILDANQDSLEQLLGKAYESRINDIIKRRLYNYDGEDIKLVLKVNRGALGEIIDNFNDGIIMGTADDYIILAVDCVESEGLYYWLMQHLEMMEVLKPLEVRAKLVERVDKAMEKYKKKT